MQKVKVILDVTGGILYDSFKGKEGKVLEQVIMLFYLSAFTNLNLNN